MYPSAKHPNLSSIRGATWLALALACSSCDDGGAALAQSSDDGGKSDGFYDPPSEFPPLPISLDDAPDSEFSLCEGSGPMSLQNAAWFMFFAANSHANAGSLTQPARALGFGNANDQWDQCNRDFNRLRDGEFIGWLPAAGQPVTDEHLSRLGPCARTWFTDILAETGGNNPGAVAAKFAAWIWQETDPSVHGIQFFSGGRIANNGDGQPVFDFGSTQGVWLEHEEANVALVVFRGSEDSTDWSKNLDSDLISFGAWGRVHGGFLKAFEPAVEALLHERVDALPPDRHLYIAGHSLGAAQATLFAAQLMDRMEAEGLDRNLAGVYAFASPRVGDATFRTRFEDAAGTLGVPVSRFTHDRDPVPRWALESGMYPVGTSYLLDYDGRVFIPNQESTIHLVNPRDHRSLAYFDAIMAAIAHGGAAAEPYQCAGG